MERTPIVPGLLDLSFQQEHKKPAKDAKKRYYNQLEEIFAKHRRIRTKGQNEKIIPSNHRSNITTGDNREDNGSDTGSDISRESATFGGETMTTDDATWDTTN
ncbi:Oidioi.mRNA.OKI2018_I69.chr1.g2948.t1.cds [Oikopleura dioica]|uniref:Oidioi.mRNA.OKI2018_I69.chr1.g2948.t1.cds n=1 Tax=Oikopleura dioica TaxID=34765 RepID=A0ABN7SZ32_OIKDI|nr:Oidioi.mRNA.OKI2018_I69.chr1.g2948.t1.cds [Oikopleura dioica]